jgi:hypothetical protein
MRPFGERFRKSTVPLQASMQDRKMAKPSPTPPFPAAEPIRDDKKA